MNAARALLGKRPLRLLIAAWNGFSDDQAALLGGSLAYYTVFSIAPLVIICIFIAGMVFGEEAARGSVAHAIQGLVGTQGAEAIQDMIKGANHPQRGLIASALGLITLGIGATTVFAQLQNALNLIWKTRFRADLSWMATVRQRFLSFGMTLGIAFLLLVSLLVSAALAALGKFMSEHLPGGALLWEAVNLGISFGVVTVLFAMIFRVLPLVHLAWRDVWAGAAFTSLLFTIGKLLIGLYLGNNSFSSTYGAAGSFVIVLVWVFYSAQILLYGAEFTRAYTLERLARRGGRLEIKESAEPIPGTSDSEFSPPAPPDREDRRRSVGTSD